MFSNDTLNGILKQLAKEVQKRGYKRFLLPPADLWNYSSCFIILTNEKPENIKPLADAYKYRIWDVKCILNESHQWGKL